MITEIPTPDELKKASRDLLRLAWDIVAESIHWYDDSDVIHERYVPEYEIILDDGRVEKIGGPANDYTPAEREAAARQYWQREQPKLSNALILVQQAIELGLKARIAEVSPFLLVVRDAREFPHEGSVEDIPFSKFRTIDAADLLRVHNAVAPHRLGTNVSDFWETLRRQRNVVMHIGWTKAPPISAHELRAHILFANHFLNPDMKWTRVLLEGSDEPDLSFPYSEDVESMTYGATLQDIGGLVGELPPSMVRQYFGFDRRARSYDCPKCAYKARQADVRFPALAQLRPPRTPGATSLYCFVCDETMPVRRERCRNTGCRSNVLSDVDGSWGQCLVCGHGNEDTEDAAVE